MVSGRSTCCGMVIGRRRRRAVSLACRSISPAPVAARTDVFCHGHRPPATCRPGKIRARAAVAVRGVAEMIGRWLDWRKRPCRSTFAKDRQTIAGWWGTDAGPAGKFGIGKRAARRTTEGSVRAAPGQFAHPFRWSPIPVLGADRCRTCSWDEAVRFLTCVRGYGQALTSGWAREPALSFRAVDGPCIDVWQRLKRFVAIQFGARKWTCSGKRPCRGS